MENGMIRPRMGAAMMPHETEAPLFIGLSGLEEAITALEVSTVALASCFSDPDCHPDEPPAEFPNLRILLLRQRVDRVRNLLNKTLDTIK